SLATVLGEREATLVLDNCEHLLPMAATMVDTLLRACPNLRILATSRQRLGIVGEAICRVPPLPVPTSSLTGPAASHHLDRLLMLESMQLLIDRIRLVRPGFRLTPSNAAALATICRRLDGIPLALELAAARAAHLPVDVVAELLATPFDLLRQ